MQEKTEKPKRQRHVYPTNRIAHLWAHQTQENARNPQGNLWFEGPVLYSYQTPIARLVKVGKGKNEKTIALISGATYSSTTSGHQSSARYATNHMVQYEVDSALIRHSGSSYWGNRGAYAVTGTPAKADVRAQVKLYIEAGKKLVEKAKRSRGYSSQMLNRAQDEFDHAVSFGADFGVKVAPIRAWEGIDEHEIDARDQRYRELSRIASQTREANRPERYRLQEEKRRAAYAAQREKDAAEFQRWLNGETVQFPYSYLYGSSIAYLQVRGDTVYTSQGAAVPLAHVQRALPIVLAYVEKGRSFTPNGATIRLGHYTVSQITEEGTLQVGCHRFEKSEIERFAAIVSALPPAKDPEEVTA